MTQVIGRCPECEAEVTAEQGPEYVGKEGVEFLIHIRGDCYHVDDRVAGVVAQTPEQRCSPT